MKNEINVFKFNGKQYSDYQNGFLGMAEETIILKGDNGKLIFEVTTYEDKVVRAKLRLGKNKSYTHIGSGYRNSDAVWEYVLNLPDGKICTAFLLDGYLSIRMIGK